MNVVADRVVTVERVKICQEVTSVNADRDTLEDTAKLVRFSIWSRYFGSISHISN